MSLLNTRTALALFALGSLCCVLAHAERSFVNGQELHEWCADAALMDNKEALNVLPAEKTKFVLASAAQCLGYVEGVVDARLPPYLPASVTAIDLTHVVWKYLDANPSQWNLSAAGIVKRALYDAYNRAPAGKK